MESDETIQLGAKTLKKGSQSRTENCVRSLRRQEAGKWHVTYGVPAPERGSESVGRRNSRTTFLRSDWPRPIARREVGVEMELGRSENKRPEQRRS
ncbi:hypothetical protein TNCV_2108831 [Trichonephila clavipes]|nr:hypothetical protein TNCV_2108831 [Trichonephila clavipes]